MEELYTRGSFEPFPPYSIRPILYPVLPQDDANADSNPNSPASLNRALNTAVRCVEADGQNLYVGSSDGMVHVYSVIIPSQGSSKSTAPHYQLGLSRAISNNAKPVEKILVLPSLSIAAVVCEGALSFYNLPEWTPNRSLPFTRAVSTVVLDDDEVFNSAGVDGTGMVSLCIVRRKTILLAKIGQTVDSQLLWAVVKEIPLPGGAIFARRFADTLCIATATEYSLVNLTQGVVTPLHLPISQTGESPSAQVRPSILSVPVVEHVVSSSDSSIRNPSNPAGKKCEFLITSHTGSVTLGVFITTNGEPTPKLLEWPSHPRSVVFSSNYLFSLLRNDTIEIHHIQTDSIEKVKTHHLPPGVEPRFLSSTRCSFHSDNEYAADTTDHDLDLVKVDRVSPFEPSLLRRQNIETTGTEDSLSQQHTLLLCGRDSVLSIEQEDLVGHAENLTSKGGFAVFERGLDSLRSNTYPATNRLVSCSLSRLEAVDQFIILEYLKRVRFYDVSQTFRHAGMDPRLIMALFPWFHKTSPSSFPAQNDDKRQSQEEVILPRFLAPLLYKLSKQGGGWKTSNDLIQDNLQLNYCPPLDAETDQDLQKLRNILEKRAKDMLHHVLLVWREQANCFKSGESINGCWAGKWMDEKMVANVNCQVDTTLLWLFVELQEDGDESAPQRLVDFLKSDHCCDLRDVEAVLYENGYQRLLAQLYLKQQRWEPVLDIWTGLIDGRLTDAMAFISKHAESGPTLAEVTQLLERIQNPRVVSKYGTWLVKKDSAAGIKILTKKTNMPWVTSAKDANGRKQVSKEAELQVLGAQKATLEELQSIDSKAAQDYLENIVVSQARVSDEQMHWDLFVALLARVEVHVSDRQMYDRMGQVAKDYSRGEFAESFFAHLALASWENPKDIDRLKLAMFLQGSDALKHESILERIEKFNLLVYERAIVLGKLGRDKEALSLLAINLKDANSAEAYCSQDGQVLSAMLASSVAQDYPALEPYASMVQRYHGSRVKMAAKTQRQNPGSGQQRKEELLKTLLTVYMENGAHQSFQIATAHLLNTQALHLESVDILKLVPEQWPLSTLETFLSQSLRRQMHRHREVQLIKAISLCRNLDVAEDVWARLRAMGGVIQESNNSNDGNQPMPPSDDDTMGTETKKPTEKLKDTQKYDFEKKATDVNEPLDSSISLPKVQDIVIGEGEEKPWSLLHVGQRGSGRKQ